jgi:hypothetical protein
VFFERFLIVCYHVVLKDNHLWNFHNIMWKKKNCNFKIKNSVTSFHFSQFHNLNVYLFISKTSQPLLVGLNASTKCVAHCNQRLSVPYLYSSFVSTTWWSAHGEEPTKDLKE